MSSMLGRLIVLLLAVATALPAFAQAPVFPIARYQALDENADPIAGAKLCSYLAGTSTPKATYSDALLATPNSNPVVADSGGLFGPIYLATGAYKFTLLTAGSDATCATGTQVWSQDTVSALAIGPTVLTKTATYTVATSDGPDVLVLADGTSGAFTVNLYTAVGNAGKRIAVKKIDSSSNAIAVDAAGAETIDGAATVLLSQPLSTLVLESDNVGWQVVSGSAPTLPLVSDGRLTLTTATPITAGDVSAATSVYFTPYRGNRIALYDGTAWVTKTFSELTLSISACTLSTPYDVFIYLNAGAAAIEHLAWTNATTRATALVMLDGTYVKSGQTTRRYVGSYYCNATGGQTDDTATKRLLYNEYHRTLRPVRGTPESGNWAYTATTFRKMNNSAANRVDVMIGNPGATVDLTLQVFVVSSGSGVEAAIGIGEDSDTAVATGQTGGAQHIVNTILPLSAHLRKRATVGFHYYQPLEYSENSGTTTWHGTVFSGRGLSGLVGLIEG